MLRGITGMNLQETNLKRWKPRCLVRMSWGPISLQEKEIFKVTRDRSILPTKREREDQA
jgi:hypothetical protein